MYIHKTETFVKDGYGNFNQRYSIINPSFWILIKCQVSSKFTGKKGDLKIIMTIIIR